jgi:hypothetical protein
MMPARCLLSPPPEGVRHGRAEAGRHIGRYIGRYGCAP